MLAFRGIIPYILAMKTNKIDVFDVKNLQLGREYDIRYDSEQKSVTAIVAAFNQDYIFLRYSQSSGKEYDQVIPAQQFSYAIDIELHQQAKIAEENRLHDLFLKLKAEQK